MVSKAFKLSGIAKRTKDDGLLVQGATAYASVDLLPLSGNEAGDLAFVDSSDKLFIFTGEGWYNIEVTAE